MTRSSPASSRSTSARSPAGTWPASPWCGPAIAADESPGALGSDNAYGVYLSQMLFITALTWLGWASSLAMPWPLLCLLTVAIVFGCCVALTSVLARTPLAVPLTGRKQQPWSTLIPRRRPREQISERAQTEQALPDPAPGDAALAGTGPETAATRTETTLIAEWIARAAARRGGAPYLEDAREPGR